MRTERERALADRILAPLLEPGGSTSRILNDLSPRVMAQLLAEFVVRTDGEYEALKNKALGGKF